MRAGHSIKFILPIIFFGGYFFVPGVAEFIQKVFRFLHEYDFHGLRDFLLAYGALAPLVSIVIITIQSLVPFVPGVILTFTNAWLFGWLLGSLYTSIGALFGAILDFYIARWYGQACFEHLVGEKYILKLNSYVKQHGATAVLITRLIPIVPFKVVSYSAGLSKLNIKAFILVTLVGQTPIILLYSLLGENILENASLILVITLLSLVVAVIIWKRNNGLMQ